MLNVITLQGRLVADPELRQTPQGVNVCSFTIACDRNMAKPSEDKKADFINITAWRHTADFVKRYFQKGSPVVLDGRLQVDTFVDKDTGKNRNSYTVMANNVNFSQGDPNRQSQPQQTQIQTPPTYTQDSFSVIEDGEDLPF